VEAVAAVTASNPKDLPFAVLYRYFITCRTCHRKFLQMSGNSKNPMENISVFHGILFDVFYIDIFYTAFFSKFFMIFNSRSA